MLKGVCFEGGGGAEGEEGLGAYTMNFKPLNLTSFRKGGRRGEVDDGENLRLHFTPEGMKGTLLNAERWGGG